MNELEVYLKCQLFRNNGIALIEYVVPVQRYLSVLRCSVHGIIIPNGYLDAINVSFETSPKS